MSFSGLEQKKSVSAVGFRCNVTGNIIEVVVIDISQRFMVLHFFTLIYIHINLFTSVCEGE